MSFFVKHMLDLSVGHLTEDTRRRMGEDSRNFFVGKPCSLPFAVKGSSYGWFIDVRDAVERSYSKAPYPSDIVDCYELAIRYDASFILFDRDAERHPDINWYGGEEQAPYYDAGNNPIDLGADGLPRDLAQIKELFNR